MLPGQLYWRNKSLKIQNQSSNLEVRQSFRTILKSYLHIGHFCSHVVVSATSFITFLARACLDEVLDWWYSYHDNQTRLLSTQLVSRHCYYVHSSTVPLIGCCSRNNQLQRCKNPCRAMSSEWIFQVQPIISCVQWNSRIFVYNICPIGISDTFFRLVLKSVADHSHTLHSWFKLAHSFRKSLFVKQRFQSLLVMNNPENDKVQNASSLRMKWKRNFTTRAVARNRQTGEPLASVLVSFSLF